MTTQDDIRDAERAASYDAQAPVAIAYALIAIAKELRVIRKVIEPKETTDEHSECD